MSDQGYNNQNLDATDDLNVFQYQKDTISQYRQNSASQQQSVILPKVRNANNNGSKIRSPPLNAAPATPRMLRNASNNVLNPSENNLNDYHINTSFQLQRANAATPSSTPQRTSSTRSSKIPPNQYETPTKDSLLPPASVDNSNKAVQSPQHQTPRRATSQSTHHRTVSQKQQAPKTEGQFHRKSIGEWDFYKTIGAGSMGKVKLAKHRRTNEVCAVKVVPRAEKIWIRQHGNDPPTTDSNELAKRMKDYEKEVGRDRRTIREAALDKIMYHPFICRLYELIPMTNHYYMLFEYVSGGQMLDYIVSHGSLKERHARKFARGIASALDYCHSNNIVHRDLKIENIMISKSGEIKIIDFGLSNMFDSHSQLKTFCGSLYFAAPELLSAQPYIGPEVDIWSFGVVLYVLVCGKVPFDDPSVSALHSKIKQGNVTYPDNISYSCVSLLQRMLVVDSSKRATLKEILNHPWMIDESERPAYNYLPHRVPLVLPLDQNVIDEIVALQLGEEQQVISQLTDILSSPEYAVAVSHWYDVKRGTAPSKSESAIPDPTISYHPLVSIYFLVDEMQKRKKLKLINNKTQLQQAQDSRQQQLQQLQNIEREKQQQLQRSNVSQLRTPAPPQGTFAPQTPQKPEPTALPQTPTIPFPEAAYTTSHAPLYYKDTELKEDSVGIPSQQVNRSQSPKSRKTSSIDHALTSSTSLDDDSGRSGLNSLLRKLSGKRVKPQWQQQNFVANDIVGMDHSQLHSISPNDSENNLEPYQPQSLQGPVVDPLVRRVGSMKITSKEKEQVTSNLQRSNFPPLPNKYEEQLQKHQRAVSTSASARKPLPPIQTSKQYTQPKMHPSARAKSVGHSRKDSFLRSREDVPPTPQLPNNPQDEGFFDDVSLNDGDDSWKRSEKSEKQLVSNFESAPTGTMPSIEFPRTLFLKGFFSVQTTSTKPLPVIRNDIISVLTKLGVQFKEVKGGFVCSHSPSIASTVAMALPDINIEQSATGNEEDDQFRHKSSTSSHSSDTKMVDAANEQLSYTSSLTSSPSVKAHRRKFSLGNGLLKKKSENYHQPPQPGKLNTNFSQLSNSFDATEMPLTPAPANVNRHRHSRSVNSTESQDSVDSLHEIKGDSDVLLSPRVEQMRSPSVIQRDPQLQQQMISLMNDKTQGVKARSPLRFEIHIVKVPLVGLFGVQFKKLTGNTWMYKTLAGEILRELNL